jgi:diacylglycerol kinase (ATP)
LIVNPAARGETALAETAAGAVSAHHGWDVETASTEVRGHGVLLAQEAARDGVDLVVAVGGDGTAREVAAGVCGSGTPMMIVPAGTGNSSYRELFGAISWIDLLAAALDGAASRSVDLNRIDPTGELSLLGFSCGWFAQIVALAAADTTTTGAAKYAGAAMAAAAAPTSFVAQVELDGAAFAGGELGLVAVGGARVRGGVFPVLPHSVIDDGRLEVLAIDAVDAAGFTELMEKVIQGRDLGDARVHRGSGRTVLIRSGSVVPSEVDGDIWDKHAGETRVEVVPGALKVIVAPG